MTPMVAMSTDFGAESSYVAQMKGVIWSIAPEVRIVDVCHSLPAHDVRAAELHLRSIAFAFPIGCVHLVVVDPGVGSERHPMAVEVHGTRFVGPDNGLFGRLVALEGARTVRLDRAHLWRTPTAPTFHGRDIFAPVAAELAAGVSLREVGSPLAETVPSLLPEPRPTARGFRGVVLGADRFGNLTTNIPVRFGERFEVGVAGERPTWVETYAEVPVGTLVALRGSDGFLEVARRERPAGLAVGTELVAERMES